MRYIVIAACKQTTCIDTSPQCCPFQQNHRVSQQLFKQCENNHRLVCLHAGRNQQLDLENHSSQNRRRQLNAKPIVVIGNNLITSLNSSHTAHWTRDMTAKQNQKILKKYRWNGFFVLKIGIASQTWNSIARARLITNGVVAVERVSFIGGGRTRIDWKPVQPRVYN